MLEDIADLKARMANLETQKLELAARIDEKAVQIRTLVVQQLMQRSR